MADMNEGYTNSQTNCVGTSLTSAGKPGWTGSCSITQGTKLFEDTSGTNLGRALTIKLSPYSGGYKFTVDPAVGWWPIDGVRPFCFFPLFLVSNTKPWAHYTGDA